MTSPEPSYNDNTPSSTASEQPIGAQLPSPPASSASTLVSHSPSRPSSLLERGLRSLHIRHNSDAAITEPSSLASSLTLQEMPPDLAQYKIMELKRHMDKAGLESPQRVTNGLFEQACSTDLLFLVDTTMSMKPYIDEAKNQIRAIIKDIKAAFFHEVEVRIAVVSYKDHNVKFHIDFLDFTPSVWKVHEFLAKLKPANGADFPEDVTGGFNQALKASWKHQTRCIIHIGDAPPHGKRYHAPTAGMDDNYPEAGSEPHGLTLEPLIDRMIKLNINYALLRIDKWTDRMASIICQKYAAAGGGCKLHPENKYASRMLPTLRGSRRGMNSGLLFEEQELGTTFSALQHLVLKSVTQSASRSAVRMISSATRSSKVESGVRSNTTALAAISEEKDHDTPMETRKPQWNRSGWFNETLTVEGFSPDLTGDSSSTLDDMLTNEDNIQINAVELLVHKRSQPFSQGATRLAHYARAQSMTDRFVVKSYKRGGKRFAHFAQDMQSQALCKAFALEFNSLLGQQTTLDFVVTMCLRRRGSSLGFNDEECLSLEPFLEGTYTKYNNNCGYVNTDIPHDQYNKAAQAFSHFTFERSQGRFLVCDIQGVGGLLTDSAIHTKDPDRFKLGDNNLGTDGFKFFFATHVCNDVCERLELKSKATMIHQGVYDFRRDWQASSDRVRCCSNRLCGKITRLPTDYDPEKPPRYHWCSTCYSQMRSSFERIQCVVPEPRHDFYVSRFLCESQGLAMPRACPDHRGQEIMVQVDAEMSEMSEKKIHPGVTMSEVISPTLEPSLQTAESKKSLWSKLRCGGSKFPR